MKFMLDTNICSYIIKHKPPQVHAKFKSLNMDDCVISSITLAELRYWVARNKKLHKKSNNAGDPKINEVVINNFIQHLEVAEFDSHAADIYGETRADLEEKGTLIGAEDLMIGSHALSLNYVLVTNNPREFTRIKGLKVENWVENLS